MRDDQVNSIEADAFSNEAQAFHNYTDKKARGAQHGERSGDDSVAGAGLLDVLQPQTVIGRTHEPQVTYPLPWLGEMVNIKLSIDVMTGNIRLDFEKAKLASQFSKEGVLDCCLEGDRYPEFCDLTKEQKIKLRLIPGGADNTKNWDCVVIIANKTGATVQMSYILSAERSTFHWIDGENCQVAQLPKATVTQYMTCVAERFPKAWFSKGRYVLKTSGFAFTDGPGSLVNPLIPNYMSSVEIDVNEDGYIHKAKFEEDFKLAVKSVNFNEAEFILAPVVNETVPDAAIFEVSGDCSHRDPAWPSARYGDDPPWIKVFGQFVDCLKTAE